MKRPRQSFTYVFAVPCVWKSTCVRHCAQRYLHCRLHELVRQFTQNRDATSFEEVSETQNRWINMTLEAAVGKIWGDAVPNEGARLSGRQEVGSGQ